MSGQDVGLVEVEQPILAEPESRRVERDSVYASQPLKLLGEVVARDHLEAVDPAGAAVVVGDSGRIMPSASVTAASVGLTRSDSDL